MSRAVGRGGSGRERMRAPRAESHRNHLRRRSTYYTYIYTDVLYFITTPVAVRRMTRTHGARAVTVARHTGVGINERPVAELNYRVYISSLCFYTRGTNVRRRPATMPERAPIVSGGGGGEVMG